MTKKRLAYWIAQLTGWGLFIFISAFVSYLEQKLTDRAVAIYFIIGLTGVGLTHLYRKIIIGSGWLEKNIIQVIPRVIVSSLVLAFITAVLQLCYTAVFISGWKTFEELNPSAALTILFNWWIIYIFWSIIYFAVHFFEKSRNEEIKNLRFEAMRTEVELNNLKAQLNPHFMFNSMNSIRALIEENPELAKESITRLSNILRSTLLMGRKRLVTVEEEIGVIFDYLKLESIRYEERLRVSIRVDEDCHQCLIPPLIVQTLCENAIKHGISKLHGGGEIEIQVSKKNQQLMIGVSNSGKISNDNNQSTGIGIANTRQRLELLFSHKAGFRIFNNGNNKVHAEIVLPEIYNYESAG